MSGDEYAIRITNREVYDAVVQLRDRVASLERRVDSVLGENVELRKRTRSLELKFYGILAGLLGAVTVFMASVVSGSGR
jgi:hypothetical protein